MDQDDDNTHTKNDVAPPPPHHHRDPRLDLTLLPFHFDVIPNHVTSLKECAQHQIQALLTKEADHPAQLTSTDEDCLDDGFVLCDLAVPCQKLRAWRHMFPRVEPFYALKCNPDPMVAAVLAQLGAGFDCASVAELELARESIRLANQQKKNAATTSSTRQPSCDDDDTATPQYFKIVYANPQRAEKDLDTALTMFERSPPLTFDGPEELYKVHSAYQKQLERWRQEQQHGISNSNNNNDNASAPPPPPPPDLILRLLVPDQHSSVPLGEKFGAAASDVDALIELALVELQLPVVGVSFHCGSGNHDPASYTTAIRLAAAAMDQINRRCSSSPRASGGGRGGCWLLDIGGGYPGIDGLWGDCGRFCGGAAAATSASITTDHNSERDGDSGKGDNTNDDDDDDDAGVETTARIAEAVTPLLDELFPTMPDASSSTIPKCTSNVQIISEPGRYFVEGAFALCSRIYRVRVEEERG